MNRLKSIGSRTTPDGWCITWDLSSATGQEILRYNAAGVLQTGTCGEIGVPSLVREVRKFEREHAGTQLRLI